MSAPVRWSRTSRTGSGSSSGDRSCAAAVPVPPATSASSTATRYLRVISPTPLAELEERPVLPAVLACEDELTARARPLRRGAPVVGVTAVRRHHQTAARLRVERELARRDRLTLARHLERLAVHPARERRVAGQDVAR